MADNANEIAQQLETDYKSGNFSKLQEDASMIDVKNNELWQAVDKKLAQDTSRLLPTGQLYLYLDAEAFDKGINKTVVGAITGHMEMSTPESILGLGNRERENESYRNPTPTFMVDDSWTPGKTQPGH